MKLHLPLKLRAALLALCLTGAPSAFSFDDTIFKFEDSTASETGTGLHTVAAENAVVSGTTKYDASGLVAGSTIGNHKLTTGLGQAFSFNGSTHIKLYDAYWSNGDGALSPSSSFTLTTYVKLDSVDGKTAALFGTGDGTGSGFAFGVKDGKLKVTTKNKTDYVLTGMTALNDNQWYALAVSYDATTHLASFYVDGEFVGNLTMGTEFNNPGGAGAAIGSTSRDTELDRWSGSMAEFQILSGSSTARGILDASYLLNPIMWNNGESTRVWDTTSKNWTDGSENTSFTTKQWAIFAKDFANTIRVTENITSAGMTVGGAYFFDVYAGATLTAGGMEISDDTTVTLKGVGSVSISGNVDSVGDNKDGILKIDSGTVTVTGAINSELNLTGGRLSVPLITGKTEVSGGRLTIKGEANAFSGSKLLISGGTVEFFYNPGSQKSCISSGTTVTVNKGGTLKLTGHDMLGWGDISPSNIVLQGKAGAGNQAILDIQDTGSCTFRPTVEMMGYSELTGTKFNSFSKDEVRDNLIVASGVGNIVSAELDVRRAARLKVEASGELTIAGIIANGGDSSGQLVKTGTGTLIVTSSAADTRNFSRGTRIEEGTLLLTGQGSLGTGAVTIATNGTLMVSGGSLGGAVTNNGMISLEAGSHLILASAIDNTGTMTVADGAEITRLNTALTFDDAKKGGRNETEGNGFGLLTGLTDAEITALKGEVVTGSGTVTWTGTQKWGYSDSYYIYTPVTSGDFEMVTKATKSVYVGENVGVVKPTSNVAQGIAVTVKKGSVWDISGLGAINYNLTLDGGTLYKGTQVSNTGTIEVEKGGSLLLASAINNTGTLTIEDGAVITLLNPPASYAAEKKLARDKSAGNGFGLLTGLTSAEISALKTATVTGNGQVNWTGDQVWGCSDSYYIYNAATRFDLDILTKAKKSVYVGENAGLVKLKANVTEGIDVTVCSGSTWDINGMADKCYTVTLDGGTLTNTGKAVDTQHKQIMGITLTANSALDGSADHCLLNSGWTATTLNLGGHTLTKKGECTFAIVNSTIYGGGVLRIEEGTLTFEQRITLGSEQDTEDTVIWLAGGNYATWGLPDTGFVLAHDAELKVGGESTAQGVVWYPKFTTGDNNLKFTTVGANDVLKIKGDITSSGELVFSGKNIELAGTVTGDSKLSVLAGGSLTVTGSVTLGATIENAGTLTLGTSGSLRFTSRDVLTQNTDVVYKDNLTSNNSGNGFSSGSYFIVQQTSAGATSNNISKVYFGNDTVAKDVATDGEKKGNVTITPEEADLKGGRYYITLGGEWVPTTTDGVTTETFVSGKFVYQNGAGATNHAADGKTSGLVLATASGKPYLTLVMKTSLNPAATEGIIMQSDAAIQLDGSNVSLSKVTIPQDIGTIPTLTLRGNGTYTMDQATGIDATATKVGTATDDYPAWTGKIVVSNTELGGASDGKFSIAKLNELATTETTDGQTSQTSTIEIRGLTGYAYSAADRTSPVVSADLKLADIPAVGDTSPAVAALTLTDGTGTAGTLYLNGKLSGTGSIVNNSTGNVSLGGNISDWKGSYKATDKNTLLIFDGSTAQALNGTVNGGSLQVAANKALTVNSSLTLDKTIANNGTLTFGTGGKLSFNSLADLTAKGEVTYTDGGAVGNGYRTGTFYVVQGGTTKKESLETVNIDKYTYSQEDGTLVWDTDGVVIKSIEQPGLYYVCKDTVIYDSVNKPNNAASNDTQGLVLMGGTLRMLTDLGGTAAGQDGSGIVLQKNPTDVPGTPTLTTISVADGVALNHVALDVSSDIKLKILGYNNETDREHVGEDIIMKQLTGDGTLVSGSGIMVKESGSFTGTYDGMVRLGTTNKEAVQILRADTNLTVIGDAGTVSLTGQNNSAADANKLGGIDTKGETVLLNNVRDDVSADGTTTKVPTKVTLVNASRMEKGVLDFTVSAEAVNGSLNSADKPVVTTGAALSLKDVTLKVHEVKNKDLGITTGGQEKDILLFVVSDKADSTVDNVKVDMSDCTWMTKYFTNFRVVQGSINVIGDANTSRYAAHGQTPNGTAGLALAGQAMFHLDPQTQNPDGELAQVLDMLDAHIESGNKGAMDKLGAALAGSSLSAVGLALADDVQRQLRSIRNRTTTMGVNECVVNEDMPYVNGWISGDGNYRQLSESGTDAGYQVSSWGGTVGVDVDVNPNLTLGVAVSALFGDYTGKAADTLTGDLDTQYVSLFARVSTGSWVNTFVGTLGRADVDLERTLPGIAGKTTYKTDGMMFGFLYEVARTFALNEDASTCVQPLFNMSFSHTSLDSATEGGTADTRLTTDSASLTQFSLGLGGRLQSIVGENEYNRASIFEARALLKLDFGDRYNKLNTALAALPNASVGIRSNESGVIGAEVGATLTIPLSQDAGSVFFDVNADFRADQAGVNGSVGYRVNF
ncbi:MAG: autotransporter domain-containing protein [Akkermansia muciniphila]|nr:autotransporter domain-containing protein [Akkermansia muciniphila]